NRAWRPSSRLETLIPHHTAAAAGIFPAVAAASCGGAIALCYHFAFTDARDRSPSIDSVSADAAADSSAFALVRALSMTAAPTPSASRILERCEALARCSEQPGGLTRVYLSPEQRAANALVLEWMRDAG